MVKYPEGYFEEKEEPYREDIEIGKIFYVDYYWEVSDLFRKGAIRKEIENMFDGKIYYWEDYRGLYMPRYYREIDFCNFDLFIEPVFWIDYNHKVKVILEAISIREIDYDLRIADPSFYKAVIKPRCKEGNP